MRPFTLRRGLRFDSFSGQSPIGRRSRASGSKGNAVRSGWTNWSGDKSAAAPATVSGDPQARCPLGESLSQEADSGRLGLTEGMIHMSVDIPAPRARRPADVAMRLPPDGVRRRWEFDRHVRHTSVLHALPRVRQ
jgi:hypothetical protein